MSKSISQYKDEMRTIMTRNGYSGEVTEMLISIMAYAIYENQFNIQVVNNEADPDKATNINNIIDYAIRRSYSIYRGQNPMITVSMKSNIVTSINKYDLIYAGKGFNVYSLEDVIADRKDYTVNLKCIIAKSLEQVEAVEDNIDTFYVDFGVKDVSESFIFEATSSTVWEEHEVTKSIQDMVDKEMPMQITSYDYGLRLYFSKTKDNRDYQSYRIKYFPYYENDIDYSDIEKMNVNGFDILLNPEGKKSIIIEKHIERDDINSGCGEKARMNLNSLGTIRSNKDLLSVFDYQFAAKVASSSFEMTKDNIIIYYAPKSGAEITESELSKYYSAMTPYIPCKIDDANNLTPIKKLLVKKAKEIQYSIKIEVYSTDTVRSKDIYDYLNGLTYKVGLNKDVYEIVSEVNELENVRYCKVTVFDNKNNKVEWIRLEIGEYLTFSQSTVDINPQ